LCGKDHGFMPIVVEVLGAKEYSDWVAKQKKSVAAAAPDPGKQWTMEELKAQGEKVYGGVCAACHQANGMGLPGAFPALSGSKVVNGPKEDQIKLVLSGRKGVFTATSMMPPQANLSDVDIAAAITYTRNSWANKTGEMVTPAEVKAARK
jgi:cytochrome c oxidase subunit 2